MILDWTKFRQHVAWRRGISPALAEDQLAWLESEGAKFGQPRNRPLEQREFAGEDIVLAVSRTASREQSERRKREITEGGQNVLQ